MTTAAQAIAWEAQYRSKPGDNGGAFAWALAGAPQYTGSAWCGAFQYACAKNLGLDLGPFTLASVMYVPSALAIGRAKGLYRISKQSQPGDWVIFDWSGRETGADHIGMIVKNDPSKSTVTTIEGNAGAAANGQRCVAYHERSRSLITGTINRQAAYSKAPAPKPVTPTVAASDWYAGTKVGKALQDHFKSTGVHDGTFDGQDAKNKAYFPNFTCIKWETVKSAIEPSPGVKAIQKGVGVTADGYLGKQTAAAIQKWAGMTGADVDGYLGTKSVQAICKKLGVSA